MSLEILKNFEYFFRIRNFCKSLKFEIKGSRSVIIKISKRAYYEKRFDFSFLCTFLIFFVIFVAFGRTTSGLWCPNKPQTTWDAKMRIFVTWRGKSFKFKFRDKTEINQIKVRSLTPTRAGEHDHLVICHILTLFFNFWSTMTKTGLRSSAICWKLKIGLRNKIYTV